MKKILPYIIIIIFILWLSSSIYLYFSWFNIEEFFLNNQYWIEYKILFLVILYILRNYLFLPSTIVILTTWLILQDFWLTLIISLVWVWTWIIQTYFVWYIFWESLKDKKEFKAVKKYRKKIEENWFKVLFLWSLFPVVPVDILYYSAWFVKYNFFKFFIAGFFGELPLIILYCYLWIQAKKYIDYLWYIIVWVFVGFLIYLFIKKQFFNKKKEIWV